MPLKLINSISKQLQNRRYTKIKSISLITIPGSVITFAVIYLYIAITQKLVESKLINIIHKCKFH